MDRAIEQLRRQAPRWGIGRGATGRRYPARFQAAVVAVVQARLRQGESLDALADAIGITRPTLARWLRRVSAPVLRPVAVERAPAPVAGESPAIVLTTPQGLRVEGLDGETLVAVLRALV